MKLTRAIIVACALVVSGFFPASAEAGACDAPARQLVVGKPNLQLLSVNAVTQANGQIVCIARIRITTKDGKPPRVVKRRFTL